MGKLSKFQKRAYETMCQHGFDIDVSISRLWSAVHGQRPPSHMSNRDMQQKLGPLVARINAKLEATKIVPGNLKQTYRIIKR